MVRKSASSLGGEGQLGREGVSGGSEGGGGYRVKMSLVTAAMEYLSRRARQRASMRAVLPEPTGLRG